MNNRVKLGIGLYRVFSRAYFHLPFLVIYLHKLGFRISVIEVIMAIYGLAVFAYTRVPTGARATARLSSRGVMMLSEGFKCIGLIVMILFQNFIGICIAQVILGLGYGIAAGADTRIINTYIDDGGRFQARSNSFMFASLLIAGLLGSVLFNIDIRLPFAASAAAGIITIVICFVLPKGPGKLAVVNKKNGQVKLSWYEKQMIGVYCLTRGIILTYFTGFLPYHLFIDQEIPVFGFIAILTSYTLLGNISSNFIVSRLKPETAGKLMNISLLLALLCYLSNNLIFITGATILLGLTSGATRPICMNGLKRNGSNIPVISNLMESIYSIINIVLLLAGGLLYEVQGFTAVLSLFMIMFVFFIIFYTISNRRIYCNENSCG